MMVAGAVAAQSRGGMAGPDGAGVVLTAACWWQMVRGDAASLVMEAKSARGVTRGRMATGCCHCQCARNNMLQSSGV